MRRFIMGFSLSLLVLLSCHASAAIVSVTGAAEIVSPPTDVQLDAFESDSLVRVFVERQGHTLSADLNANITVPGTSPLPSELTNLNLSPGTLLAGTLVNSIYVHYDPTMPSGRLEGTLTFDHVVLGIMTRSAALSNSHSELGVAGSSYGTGANSGPMDHDHPEFPDFVTLSEDRRTVSFNVAAGPGHDSMRIVTSAVPEPGSMFLLALGTVPVLVGRRVLRNGRDA